MNDKNDMLLNQSANETQTKLRTCKAIVRRIAFIFFFTIVLVAIASTVNLYQMASNQQLSLLIATTVVFATILSGSIWILNKFYSQNKSAKLFFLVIEILLYAGLLMVNASILTTGAP